MQTHTMEAGMALRPLLSDSQYHELAARFELLWGSPGAGRHQREMSALIDLLEAHEQGQARLA